MSEGISAMVVPVIVIAAIGWAVFLNAGTVHCRAGNIGQAAQAQTVCQPTEFHLPRVDK